jgi:hypothetical protein
MSIYACHILICPSICGTGSLPGSSWAVGMQSLVELNVQNNSLTGQLPEVWFNTPKTFPNMMGINMRSNKLQGPVPVMDKYSPFAHIRLYVVPMDDGYGLCREYPRLHGRQTLMSINFEHDWNASDVAALPSCMPGKFSSFSPCVVRIGIIVGHYLEYRYLQSAQNKSHFNCCYWQTLGWCHALH